MDLISLAVPFFLLCVIIEIIADIKKKTGYIRLNDAIGSMATGTLSRTIGIFTKFVPILIYGMFYEEISFLTIPESAFAVNTLSGVFAFLGLLLVYDFLYYWNHRIGHERTLLWAAHSVHHQSEDYNLTTALRQPFTYFFFSWIFYIPLVLIGIPPKVFATVAAVDLIYQFWVHTQFIGKMGWFDRIFVSPSNHRVHHGQNLIYLDKNYGGILVIWDRMFGTFQEELEEEPVVYGVTKATKSWNPFWVNFEVYHSMFMDFIHATNWKDRLYVWVSRTGWRPTDVAQKYPVQYSDTKNFVKYDPTMKPGIPFYLLFQFIALGIAVPVLLNYEAILPLTTLLVLCIPFWITLFSIGALSESKSFASYVEWGRLALGTLALGGISLFAEITPSMEMLLVGVAYLGISLVWFGITQITARQTNTQVIPA